ncbi:MAG: adenosine-specific kinase [Candidatus Binatia bacterium]
MSWRRWSGDRRGDEQASPSNALAFFFGQRSQAIKTVSEVCTIRCATANPIEVVIVETRTGSRYSGGELTAARAKASR